MKKLNDILTFLFRKESKNYVALFVLLFTLGVGNIWGATCYYTVEIRAICETGASGNVFVKSGTQNANTGSSLTTNINSCTTTVSTLDGSRSTTTTDLPVTFYAKPGSGSYVEGWYSDSNGQNALVVNANAAPYLTMLNDQFSINVNNVYAGAGRAVKFKQANYYEAGVKGYDASHRSTITVYVKFAKEATGNKFKPQLTVTSSNFSQGVVSASMTDVTNASWKSTSYTSTPNDYTLTEDASIEQIFNVKAMATRGYKFKNWTVAGNPRTTDKSSDTQALTSFTVTLTDEMTKGANNIISNNDVATANFEEDALKDFKIQKEANTGWVSWKYTYWSTTGRNFTSSVGSASSYTEPENFKDSIFVLLEETEKEYSQMLYGSDKIRMTANPASGYIFSGWYVRRDMKPDSLLTTERVLETSLFEDNLIFVPVFAIDPSGLVNANDYFVVGESACQTLEQAIAAATQSQHKTIVQLKDYMVPAGNYTIPVGVTLLIPYKDNYWLSTPLERSSSKAVPTGAYRTLTLEDGAHLEVYGTIEVGGMQSSGGGTAIGEQGIGCPTGEYGCLQMNGSSSITLNNGAKLYAWGYILGQRENGKYLCEIDARRGSEVREQFQIMDWKGGGYTTEMFAGNNSNIDNPNSFKVLPINQYYIQNIEIPVKYRPGAKLSGAGSVAVVLLEGAAPTTVQMDNAGIIGAKYTNKQDDAIFLMNDEDDSEDTWVRKYYDITTDQQVYEINNAAYIGCLVLNLGGYKADSREYKLPITNNFKIHLLSGNMEVTQHTEFLAGSELIVNKKSRMTIPQNVNIYLYDKEDWGNYISIGNSNGIVMGPGTTVKWRPGGRPTVRRDAQTDEVKIEDTKFTISGTLDVQGKLFTTSHGASIISTNEDAGTIIFSSDAPVDNYVYQLKSPSLLPSDNAYKQIQCTSAQLKNETGYRTTAETTEGTSYCFINGAWRSFVQEEDECFVSETVETVKTYYAKPKDLVALFSGEEDENHLFHSSDNSRTFIHTLDNDGNCQWWEVTATATPGIYHCEHPKNDVYYYYDDDTYDAWLEKKYKVSWVNWDGSPVNYTNSEDEEVNYYMVSYNSMPQWLSANPTRNYDASHEYTFVGWTPDLAPVTDDVTYMATYQERDRMYSITFNNESDELIQVLYCKLGEMPVCDKYDAAANNKEWKTVDGEQPLGAVSKNEVYKLFAKDEDGPFTIRFVNWDGTELLAYDQAEGDNAKIVSGSTPAYTGATPTKPADNSHVYTFVGWTPSIEPATQNMTYTAKFEVQQLTGLNVVDDQTLTSDLVIPNVRITTTGSLNVTGSITADNFYLESNGSTASGQLIASDNDKINATNVYFDLKLNTEARHWHAFGVPWSIGNLDDVKLLADGQPMTLGRDYEIIYYNGATRASQGAGAHCWEYVTDHGKTLTPGQGYMIAFGRAVNTVRFTKATGTPILFNGTVELDANTGDADNGGWNAMANPKVFHAAMASGPTVGYVHNGGEIGSDGYDVYDLAAKKFIVGKMVYVQSAGDQSIVFNASSATPISPATAPARRTNTGRVTDKRYLSLSDYYQVGIADANAQGGSVYVLPEEDKEDKYVIGHDLSHLGISNQKAQIWVFRYGTKLALNTTAPVDGVADYALRVYAPKNGEYTITNIQSPMSDEEYVLYLTRDGEAVWNLSDGAYTAELTAGVHKEYGLRLSARKSPAVVTGMDEAIVDAKGETQKVLINNQVFIIREGNVYSIDGQMVK